MTDCIFCKVANKEIPSEVLYEDADTLAFLDIHPNNPGHTLVVPKVHAANLYEVNDESLSSFMKTVRRMAIAVKKAMSADGINVIMNNDTAAGQIIFHAHMHVIPRFSNDGYKPWPQKTYKEGEAAIVGEKIRKVL